MLEELDMPGEFVVAGGRLFLKPNATAGSSTRHNSDFASASSSTGPEAWQKDVVAATAERLVSIVGNQESPVQYLQFKGITFTQSMVTFLGGTSAPRYMAPGTGDWSIYPSAALYLEGTSHIQVANCTFEEIGGNAGE